MRKALAHIATFVAVLAVFLAGPLFAFADTAQVVATLVGADADLVSSATTIQASPDGRFTIYINADEHKDPDVLADWVVFFEGKEDAPLIMEDVRCMVIDSDAAGVEMAESLQSRLAENQMTILKEQAPLVLSKADNGLFDVVVVSDDAGALYGAATIAERPNVVVVHR